MNQFKRISTAESRELIAKGNVAIVDVRDPQSYNSSHIEGAVYLDNSTAQQFIADTDSSTPVLVYCYHGNSSQGAAQYLVEQGFTDVYSMDGGFEVWRTET